MDFNKNEKMETNLSHGKNSPKKLCHIYCFRIVWEESGVLVKFTDQKWVNIGERILHNILIVQSTMDEFMVVARPNEIESYEEISIIPK